MLVLCIIFKRLMLNLSNSYGLRQVLFELGKNPALFLHDALSAKDRESRSKSEPFNIYSFSSFKYVEKK